MNIAFREISEMEFDTLPYPVILKSETLNRKFGLVENDEGKGFLIGWQSDTVLPKLFSIGINNIAIGIDLGFTILDGSSGMVLLMLDLSFFFLDLKRLGKKLYVICEQEVLIVCASGYILLESIVLSDTVDETLIIDDQLRVKCFDGFVLNLP